MNVGLGEAGDSGRRETQRGQNVFCRENQEDLLMDWIEGLKEREGTRMT